MKVLLTGGAGYIGSHTAIELINSGHQIVIVDNLSNSSIESVKRTVEITDVTPVFYELDLREQDKLLEVFKNEQPDAVIHFAGLKAVGESVAKPLEYYDNNIASSLSLLKVMAETEVSQLVFSSSATVYGTPTELPLTEKSTTGKGITNPYGWTKYMIEQIIQDTTKANPQLKATILRYFNPVGAHQSGRIGEDPTGIPNNLLPFISQVAVGKLEKVGVFGDDYDTPDGTGVRDYIHVVDLARGHVKALENISLGAKVYNLGTGRGTSVLELITSFSKACGHEIPYEIRARREGDIASCYADPTLAETELGWRADLTIDDACVDSWRWQSQNPNGYHK
ncbi:UDP-glucose 4-epimerase GalE [Candidatus Saccharibacteria bacterium]|nr:UDP-glucose 4-epimerase GalE [Candidatus Saccharibacteria bacterium]